MTESIIRPRKASRLPSGRMCSPDERDRWANRVLRGADEAVVAEALGVKVDTIHAWVMDVLRRRGRA